MYVLRLGSRYVIDEVSSTGGAFSYVHDLNDAKTFPTSRDAIRFVESVAFDNGSHRGFKSGGLTLVEIKEMHPMPRYEVVREL